MLSEQGFGCLLIEPSRENVKEYLVIIQHVAGKEYLVIIQHVAGNRLN